MDRRRTLSPPRGNPMRASTGSVAYDPRAGYRSSMDRSTYEQDPEAYYRSLDNPPSRISGRPPRREPGPDDHINRSATSPLPRVPYPQDVDDRLYEPSYYRRRPTLEFDDPGYAPSPRFHRSERADHRFEPVEMPPEPRFERVDMPEPRFDRMRPASPRHGRMERDRVPPSPAHNPIIHGQSRFTREPEPREYAYDEGEYIVSPARSGRRRFSNQRYPLSTRDLDRYARENEAAEAERERASRERPPQRRIAIPPYDPRDGAPLSPPEEEQYSYGDEYDELGRPSAKPIPRRPRRNSDDEPPRSRIYDPSHYRPSQPSNYASSSRAHGRLSSRDDDMYRIDTNRASRDPRHWSAVSPHPEEFDRHRSSTEPIARIQPPELRLTKPENPVPPAPKPTNYKPPAVFDDSDEDDVPRRDREKRDKGERRVRHASDDLDNSRELREDRSNSPADKDSKTKEDTRPKSILKEPTQRFPDRPIDQREGVLPLKETLEKKNIPANARWTRINRKLVNAEALREKEERFQELWGSNGKPDYVIVLRALSKDEIVAFTKRTAELREQWDREDEERARKDREKKEKRERREGKDSDRDSKEVDRPKERDVPDRPERGSKDYDRPRERESLDYDRPRERASLDDDRPRERDLKDYDRPRERDPRDYDRPRDRDVYEYDRDRPRDRGDKEYDREPRERRKTQDYEPDRRSKDDKEPRLQIEPAPAQEKPPSSPKVGEKKAVVFKDENIPPKPVIVNHKDENDDGTNRYTIQKAGNRDVVVASRGPANTASPGALKEDPEVRKVTFKGLD